MAGFALVFAFDSSAIVFALAFDSCVMAAFALAFDSVLLLLHDGYFVSWFRLE